MINLGPKLFLRPNICTTNLTIHTRYDFSNFLYKKLLIERTILYDMIFESFRFHVQVFKINKRV